jgi:hypothetical protein
MTPTSRTQVKALARRGNGPRQLKITLGGQLMFITEDVNQPARNMRVSPDVFEAMLKGVLDGEASQEA